MTGKRALDLLGCLVLAPVAGPLGLVLAVLVRLVDGPPVLHRATRVGQHGATFSLLKFRSMRVGPAGPGVTAAGDSRVTRLGRVLRRTKLDELPQLLNVAGGSMSLVGPRPEDPRFVALYTPEQRQVLGVRPGITGPVALRYRDEETLAAGRGDVDLEDWYATTLLPQKLALDLEYVRTATLLGDLRVLAATAAVPLRRVGPAQ